MRFSELAHDRFSVLEYEHRSVEQEYIDQILAAGMAAPTACNFQPQRILVINDAPKLHQLARVVPSKYYTPLAFLVCYDTTKCWTRPMDGSSSGEIDAAIVTTHMMLQATDLGLGTIWVMYWDPARMKQEFSLPEHIVPAALLIAGHKAPEAKPRNGHWASRSLDEILL